MTVYYCEKCGTDTKFAFVRGVEGSVWDCLVCGFKIKDLAKYPWTYKRPPSARM